MATYVDRAQMEKDIKASYEVPNNVVKAVPKPIVSVRTSAYQHGPYIAQCIESIISQKTTFGFEFIIGEDFSTDGTRETILEYAKKYPDIIRVVTADHNVGMEANAHRCMRLMRGKYVALCESDDYWTDPYKLQKQVDFLESHPDYALCFHPVRVFFENNEEPETIYPKETSGFTVKKLLQGNFIQTNSVMHIRKNYDHMPINIMPGDWYWYLYHATFGKIGFINEVMSAYRRHMGGMWWDSYKDRDNLWISQGVPHLMLHEELLKLFGDNPEYKEIIISQIAHTFNEMIKVEEKQHINLVEEAFVRAPRASKIFLMHQYKEFTKAKKQLEDKEHINEELQAESEALKHKINELEEKLHASLLRKTYHHTRRALGKARRLLHHRQAK